MGLRASLLLLIVAGLPAVASAQYTPYGAPRSPSVIRPARAWENYMHVPDGHCGCAMPVRCNDYHHCCNTCGIRPVCWLKRVGRMLDCLLPCDCCHGGLLGCGGCGHCSGYGGGEFSPGCSSCDAPALADPFQDDPLPPKPAPEPARDVRSQPMRKLPQSIARDPRPSAQARVQPSESTEEVRYTDPSASARPAHSKSRPAMLSKASEKSVLRRTSLEEEVSEPAEFAVAAEEAKPIKKVPIVRGDDYWAGVPENPLRTPR
jgi:hypothetical protein